MKNNFILKISVCLLLTTNLILAEGRFDFLREIYNKTSDRAATWLWNGNFSDFSKAVIHRGLEHAAINAFAAGIIGGFNYCWQQSIGRFYWQVLYRNSSPYYKPQILTGVPEPIGFSQPERVYLDKLEHPEKYAKEVRNVIFCGPSGTGKTCRARYIASRVGCAFFALTPNTFSRVDPEDLPWAAANFVNQIKRYGKAILFIDEIDAVAQKRKMKVTGKTNTTDQVSQSVLDLILPELSGFIDEGKVILMGTTNREEIIDPGLKSRVTFIQVGLPEVDERAEMLKSFFLDPNVVKMPQDHLNEEVILRLAKNTPDYSGRDLKQLAIHIGEQAIGQNKPITAGFALENLLGWEAMQGRQPRSIQFAGDENKLGGKNDDEQWMERRQSFSESFSKYLSRDHTLKKILVCADWNRIITVSRHNKLDISTTNWDLIAQNVCKDMAPIISSELIANDKVVFNYTPFILQQLCPCPSVNKKTHENKKATSPCVNMKVKKKKSMPIIDPPFHPKTKVQWDKINHQIQSITYFKN